ncbi:MAG: serine/threonine protein kinase, partial [Deltaproteobacteria bacterium]|nr:serine/threonine protein kinase [Deltaproteobacteria bacterium]
TKDLLGQIVDGRYRIERVVGRGGMGTVYACRHVVVGKEFAIKVLREGIERSEEVLQRFIREAQAANAVKSRHICETLDFGQLPNGALYVVMELLDGMSLTRLLREQAASRPVLKHIFVQIAETLQRAHDRHIVHRDLKPDNVVLVNDDGDRHFVKLVDFGIAKVLQKDASDLTETGVILGTPYYMSPEQARGDSVDHRSDIYALGVMMYRAFTGKLPFVADTAMGVLTRHLTEKPQLPSEVRDIDLATERLILRCLEKRPVDRFQAMAEVAAALRSIPDDDETTHGRRARQATPTRVDSPVVRGGVDDAKTDPHPAGASFEPAVAHAAYGAEPARAPLPSHGEPRVSYASHPPGVLTASGSFPGTVPTASGNYPNAVFTASGNYPNAVFTASGSFPGPVLTASGNYPNAVFTASGSHPAASVSALRGMPSLGGPMEAARPLDLRGGDALPPHLQGEAHTARGVVSTRMPAHDGGRGTRTRVAFAAVGLVVVGAALGLVATRSSSPSTTSGAPASTDVMVASPAPKAPASSAPAPSASAVTLTSGSETPVASSNSVSPIVPPPPAPNVARPATPATQASGGSSGVTGRSWSSNSTPPPSPAKPPPPDPHVPPDGEIRSPF